MERCYKGSDSWLVIDSMLPVNLLSLKQNVVTLHFIVAENNSENGMNEAGILNT